MYSLSRLSSAVDGQLLAKRRRTAYGGYVGPMGLQIQPRNEKFFTRFSKAGSNLVESAAILINRGGSRCPLLALSRSQTAFA
jgi:hypothetical protein